MQEDEEATVRTITAYRQIISEVVQKHRGRVVDSPGDNILAEFASVIDAVSSAFEIQEELKAKNAELPDERKMEFRIGVNLVVVGGMLVWRAASPPVEVASVEKMAFPLPDRPSIAVLAFDKLSRDPDQKYFSDG
jgi:class 3 adenylate cyclase